MKIAVVILMKGLVLFPFLGSASKFERLNQNIIYRDSSKVTYELNWMLSWGGDSKLALVCPKVNFLRKHEFEGINFYYGGGLGIHFALVAGYGSVSGITGIEKSIFNFETSINHFRTSKSNDGNGGIREPFSQNLYSLKFGVKIKKIRLNLVRSFILSERIPFGQERIPLLDIGNFDDKIWGIELQFIN